MSARPAEAPLPPLDVAAAPGHLGVPAPERERDEQAPPLSEGVWDVGVHDMNGDTLPDLVVATGGPGSSSGVISLLFNPGGDAPLGSWDSVTLGTRGDYGRLAVADIDGDGVKDVAALTFSTQVLRWWLLGSDHSVLDERSMSFANAALPGRQCAAPRPVTLTPPTLASLAFADLDADRTLELAVAGYVGNAQGGSFLFSFDRESGCFDARPGFAWTTRGSLKLRFFDVDDDGALDIVTSHYALTRPTAVVPGCPDCLEWGEWRSPFGGPATPLLARFGNRALLAAAPVPELNVVDFDAIRTPDGVRFALAGSAHLCPARDCWSEGQAGFVSVVDSGGRELWSSSEWKQHVEGAALVDEARLLPRAVSFGGDVERPVLSAGYWWGTRRKESPCSRVAACAGPLTVGAFGSAPSMVDSASFVQTLGFMGRAPAALKQHCEIAPGPLLSLPEVPVAVVELRSSQRELPRAAHSWVSGSSVVTLAGDAARELGRVCVRYAASARPDLVVADSKQGLRLISLN